MTRVAEGGIDQEGCGVAPETFLHRDLLPEDMALDHSNIFGVVGEYHFDVTSTITRGMSSCVRSPKV